MKIEIKDRIKSGQRFLIYKDTSTGPIYQCLDPKKKLSNWKKGACEIISCAKYISVVSDESPLQVSIFY